MEFIVGWENQHHERRRNQCVFEDGQPIGRIYEDPGMRPELQWFWSITEFVHPRSRVVHNGRVPTFEEAKARLAASWRRWNEWRAGA